MYWSIDENKCVISELYVDGNNIINPWGIETADSFSFFSLEKGEGWRYKILKENYNFNENKYYAEIITKMKESEWKLVSKDILKDNKIIRYAELLTFKDGYFMDFVLRFRFKKKFISYVKINNKKYKHNNTNIYYQFPVNSVLLIGKNFKISISVLESIIPKKFQQVIYVKDAINEWVVHIRMIPIKWDKEVIKICTKWAGTKPLPQKISNFLLKNRWIKKQLWYRGEKKPYKCKLLKLINPCAFGMVKVEKNTKFMLHTSLEIR